MVCKAFRPGRVIAIGHSDQQQQGRRSFDRQGRKSHSLFSRLNSQVALHSSNVGEAGTIADLIYGGAGAMTRRDVEAPERISGDSGVAFLAQLADQVIGAEPGEPPR